MIAPSPAPTALSLPLRTPRRARRPIVSPAGTGPRFTVDGDAALESHLAATCGQIAAGLRGLLPENRIEAILLGGGYGRGEGGVWRTPDGDRPYNDLEFYVFLRGNRHWNERRHGRALHVLGEILTPQAGIEVEFKIASRAEFAASGVSMFSYDLISGHRWLAGDETFFDGCEHHREGEEIPLAEATRLMMNRCTGLLLAQERLRRTVYTANDADFVTRNIAKAQLGVGDAVLTALAQYHWSAPERHRRLERLLLTERMDWLREVCRHHAAGVAFKLHPERGTASAAEIAPRHAEVSQLCRQVFLWLENRRLGTAFTSPREYALSPRRKADGSALRNVLVNAKLFGGRALAAAPQRHPRDRVLNTLPLLLWDDATFADPDLLGFVHRELRTGAGDFARVVKAYTALWSRVN